MSKVIKYVCSHCKQTLPLSSFYNHPSNKLGRTYNCRSCTKANSNKQYANPAIRKKKLAHAKSQQNRLKTALALLDRSRILLLTHFGPVPEVQALTCEIVGLLRTFRAFSTGSN